MAHEKAQNEPADSRNVTGTASTPDGRWTNTEGKPPRAVPQADKPTTAEEAEGPVPKPDHIPTDEQSSAASSR